MLKVNGNLGIDTLFTVYCDFVLYHIGLVTSAHHTRPVEDARGEQRDSVL